MKNNIKKLFAIVVGLFSVFSLNFVNAVPPWYSTRPLDRCELYKRYVDERRIPRTLIVGSGRGLLSFGDKVVATKYDEYAYGDKKYDYFLVDYSPDLCPDYLCNATNARLMESLGRKDWDKCFLEFLPNSVNMRGALKNVLSLVRPGGKVYMNAIDFFNSEYDSDFPGLPRRFSIFRNYFKDILKSMGIEKICNFPVELGKRTKETRGFFKYVYGIGRDVATIRLVEWFDTAWPSRIWNSTNPYVWEIVKSR